MRFHNWFYFHFSNHFFIQQQPFLISGGGRSLKKKVKDVTETSGFVVVLVDP